MSATAEKPPSLMTVAEFLAWPGDGLIVETESGGARRLAAIAVTGPLAGAYGGTHLA